MKKSNQKKIRWIIREMEKEERSVYRIARVQQVSPCQVREPYYSYQEAGSILLLRNLGEKQHGCLKGEQRLILNARKNHHIAGALTLDKSIDVTVYYYIYKCSHNKSEVKSKRWNPLRNLITESN